MHVHIFELANMYTACHAWFQGSVAWQALWMPPSSFTAATVRKSKSPASERGRAEAKQSPQSTRAHASRSRCGC